MLLGLTRSLTLVRAVILPGHGRAPSAPIISLLIRRPSSPYDSPYPTLRLGSPRAGGSPPTTPVDRVGPRCRSQPGDSFVVSAAAGPAGQMLHAVVDSSAMRPGSDLPYVAVPDRGVGAPTLIIHSWWGLTPSFTGYADRLAEQGFLAACADLYGGQTATTVAEARALRARRRREPMYRTLLRLLEVLRVHPAADGDRVALIGFSMGAHWAVWLTQRPGVPVAAVVLYYAARAGDFSTASAPVLAHFADDDQFVSTTGRRTMERAMRTAGLAYAAHDYPGTGHWFAEPDQPTYDRAADVLAFDRTVAFLRAPPR